MIAALFGALVVAMAVIVVTLVERAARRAGLGRRPAVIVVGALGAWLATTGVAAATGALALDGGPPLPMALPWLLGIATVLGLRRPTGRALIAATAPAAVVALEAFRVPVELVLWRLGADGRLAVELTFAGRNPDILIGLTAIPIAILAWRRTPRPRLALAWHALGLGCLIHIVAMAATSAPGPQHALDLTPATTVVGTFPFVWLPGFLVPLAAIGHGVGIAQALAARHGRTGATTPRPGAARRA